MPSIERVNGLSIFACKQATPTGSIPAKFAENLISSWIAVNAYQSTQSFKRQKASQA
jgi:hypothetical protein